MLVTHRMRGLYTLGTAVQLVAASLVYWGLFSLVDGYYSELVQPERYQIYYLLVLAGLGLEAAYRYKTEANLLNLGFARLHQVVLQQTLAASALMFFFLVATKDPVISRFFLFTFTGLLYLTLVLTLYLVPPLLARRVFRGIRQENTLLVGSTRSANGLRHWLDRKAEIGLRPVGLLTPMRTEETCAYPILGTMENMEQVARDQKVTQVILTEFPSSTQFINTMIRVTEAFGIRLLVVINLEEKFGHPILYTKDDGVQLLGLREEVLENPIHRAVKRVLDVAVALPVTLVVLPPLALLVWLAQRLQSPGPLGYVQKRAGLMNNEFKILKFRTMHPDNSDEARQATAGDRRIYPAGRWLRKFSLDEMPQFLNVLRGDMSVVGPRPHLVEHNERFARIMRSYHIRALVKPGITGLAQVRGFRGEATTDELLRKRIESDLYYMEHWSLGLDLLVLLRTVWQVLRPPASAI